jgi:zinc/manganese transport system ATP-binding protein
MPEIILNDLTLGYDRHPAVHHLNAVIKSGSMTAIIGPNGAGKSTLMKGIVGALPPLDGKITMVCKKCISKNNRDNIAYLPQQADIDRSFPVSIFDLVAMGLWREVGAFGMINAAQTSRINNALATVGLTGFERRPISALSGGQMQRVLFARLLLQEADLILLDEPFTSIDAKTAADLMLLVQSWHAEGRTVLAVLHDLDTVRDQIPDTMMIAREMVAHGPTERVLTPANLMRARQICEAFDNNASVCMPEVRGIQ